MIKRTTYSARELVKGQETWIQINADLVGKIKGSELGREYNQKSTYWAYRVYEIGKACHLTVYVPYRSRYGIDDYLRNRWDDIMVLSDRELLSNIPY